MGSNCFEEEFKYCWRKDKNKIPRGDTVQKCSELLNVLGERAVGFGEIGAAPELLSCPLSVLGRAQHQFPSTPRACSGTLRLSENLTHSGPRVHWILLGHVLSMGHLVVLDEP